MSTVSADARRIPLRIANKKAYVWDVDGAVSNSSTIDIATIRSKYHICGILVGTLPHLSQQNVFLGVPLVLMPEEAVLLVENELAIMVNDSHAHLKPTLQQLQRWNAGQEEAVRQQVATTEAKGAKESTKQGRAMSEEALQKRRIREERRLVESSKAAEAATTSDGPVTLFVPQPVSGPAKVASPSTTSGTNAQAMKLTSIPHTVVIPAPSSSLEWYDPDAVSYTAIQAAKDAGIWDYPSDLQERAKCGVFRNLWEQGYFMGGGIKFGGDYLVYPGDPLRYHSHFSASIVESPTAPLQPMEIVAHGRLGTATKKAHLLCGWDDEKQETTYLSIEWAGFG